MKLVHRDTTQAAEQTFAPGDEIRVWFKILEQGKERMGQFEGIVMRLRGAGPSKTFTVRRVTYGEGVERVFPIDSRTIARIEVLKKGRVRRSRLYFLRTVIGKTRIAAADATASSQQGAEQASTTEQSTGADTATEKAEGAVAATSLPPTQSAVQAGKTLERPNANT